MPADTPTLDRREANNSNWAGATLVSRSELNISAFGGVYFTMKKLLAIIGCVLALGFAAVPTSQAHGWHGRENCYGGGYYGRSGISINVGGLYPGFGYGYAAPYYPTYEYAPVAYGYGYDDDYYAQPVVYTSTRYYRTYRTRRYVSYDREEHRTHRRSHHHRHSDRG